MYRHTLELKEVALTDVQVLIPIDHLLVIVDVVAPNLQESTIFTKTNREGHVLYQLLVIHGPPNWDLVLDIFLSFFAHT